MFGLYANEALTHVQKEEMDRIVLATERQVPQALSQLFLDVSRPQQKVLCIFPAIRLVHVTSPA